MLQDVGGSPPTKTSWGYVFEPFKVGCTFCLPQTRFAPLMEPTSFKHVPTKAGWANPRLCIMSPEPSEARWARARWRNVPGQGTGSKRCTCWRTTPDGWKQTDIRKGSYGCD